jgi:PAS domain S-box-containing protein
VRQERKDKNKDCEHLYEQIVKAKADWEATFDSIADMICILDKDGKIVRVNRSFSRRLKKTYEEIIGAHCTEMIHDSPVSPASRPFCSMFDAAEPVPKEQDLAIEGDIFTASLSPFHDSAGNLQGSVLIFRDVTEKKKLEERLIQSEKMAAVGTFAAEIGHEINNHLDYVGNYLYLLSESLATDFAKRRYIEKIQIGINNLTLMTCDLLEFARPQIEPFEPLELSRVIDAALELADKKIVDTRVRILKRYGCQDKMIVGSARMLQQVFLNLFQNALDAMQPGGQITVTTSDDKLRCTVDIEDTGFGIAEKNLARIFEPFFTTKKSKDKRGTGLGLAICYNIIRQHDGDISVISKEGKGTVVSISLPAAVRHSK